MVKTREISIARLYLSDGKSEIPQLKLVVQDNGNYIVFYNDKKFEGRTGELLESNGISLKVDNINAPIGTEFTVSYVSKLKAITDLQNALSVVDQGKDTGMLTLSLTGDNPDLIEKIVNSISNNYLAQNIARQAAQDAKSLDFLNQQLPKVRSDLDIAEDKLNQYRRQRILSTYR